MVQLGLWSSRSHLGREQPVLGGQGLSSIKRWQYQVPQLPLEVEEGVSESLSRESSYPWGLLGCPLPTGGLDSPAKSRGWRIRLLVRARVVENTSSSRSRSASSELHIAKTRGLPAGGIQVSAREYGSQAPSPVPITPVTATSESLAELGFSQKRDLFWPRSPALLPDRTLEGTGELKTIKGSGSLHPRVRALQAQFWPAQIHPGSRRPGVGYSAVLGPGHLTNWSPHSGTIQFLRKGTRMLLEELSNMLMAYLRVSVTKQSSVSQGRPNTRAVWRPPAQSSGLGAHLQT